MAEVRATTKLDSRGFEVGTKKMKKSLSGLSSKPGDIKSAIAGAFAVRALVGLGKEAIQFGSTISDLADQAGLTTDQFQALEVAALNAGVKQEKIRTVMSKLNVVMGQAKSGMKTYVDLFKKVGISQQELVASSPVQMLERLAKVMSESERGSVEFGAALEILGTRSGAQLVEVFRKINDEGLDVMIERGKKAGQIMGEDLVNNLDSAADALERFDRAKKTAMGNLINLFRQAGGTVGRGVFSFTERLKGRHGFQSFGESQADKDIQAGEKAEKKRMAGIKDREAAQKALAESTFAAEEKALDKLVDSFKTKEADPFAIDEDKAAEKLNEFKKKFAELSATGGGGVDADRIARIGGTLGGAVSPALQLARQNLDLDRKRNELIQSQTAEFRKALEESGGLG
jgi:hypothetical protein